MEIIVIGAGLGGLFCGALLAREGHKVTVLEKNSHIGGGLQTFVRNGESYETGMHVAGGFHEQGSLYRICRYLGIWDRLDIAQSDLMSVVTYLAEGRTYRIPAGREAFIGYLSDVFPEESGNIRNYTDALFRLSEEEKLFYMKSNPGTYPVHSDEFMMPADKFIAKYIGSPELRSLLAFVNPLYAGVPGHSPAYLHAMISVMFIDHPCRFAGGSSQLADALSWVIIRDGGAVLTRRNVTRILVEDRTVKCVVDSEGREYRADTYISDIHPCFLPDMIEGKAFTPGYCERLRTIPDTVSAFKVYVRLKPGRVPFVEHPVSVLDSMSNTWKLSAHDPQGWPHGVSCFMSPSADGRWATHISALSLMSWEEVSRWAGTRTGHRTPEYGEWKKVRTERVLDMVSKVFPDIREDMTECFAASPLTFRDWLGSRNGSIYGYFKDSENMVMSQLPIRTKVTNLLLTGQNVNMHGIGGVPMTAIETVETLVGTGVIVNKIRKMR
ncbi:MAG: NAD(P)/FAD-dependent oxidoreductase [Bacteroidaceae bacterium]|nr:NAD(P)/FAD-dependent oxidoreductase [Bacteroidaceae bacterium]